MGRVSRVARMRDGMHVASSARMAHRPTWRLVEPAARRPRGKVRALLRAGAVAVGSVVAAGPLAACNYKSCRYEPAFCEFDRPDAGIPDLGGGDSSALPPADLGGAADDGGGHD